MEQWELQNAFGTAIRDMMLSNRTASVNAGDTPQMGANYDLYLLKGERVVSAMCRSRARSTAQTLADVVGEDKQAGPRACQYLNAPSSDFLAVALPAKDRIMLLSSVSGLADGEGIAVVPHIGAHSMARTLCYSFSGRVELGEDVRALGTSHLRECDEATYLFLERLLTRWRLLVGGRLAWSGGVSIDDRRALSRQLTATGRIMFSFLGMDETRMTVGSFPLPYPFFGTYYPARAAWMMMCLYGGLRRSFANVMDSLRVVMDNERLLPMIELKTGNRAKMPPEWDECARVAERHGMFFEVKRMQNAVTVCLCPMTPNMSPATFFAMRAPVSVLWQLRASVADSARDMQQE
jgi:hypothetical protein